MVFDKNIEGNQILKSSSQFLTPKKYCCLKSRSILKYILLKK